MNVVTYEKLAASRALVALAVLLFGSTARGNITRLTPTQTTAGGPTFTIIVSDDDMEAEPADEFTFNGVPVSKQFLNNVDIRITIPASLIQEPGVVQVQLVGYNSLPFTINPPPMITTGPLPAANAGEVYAAANTRTGGTGPFTWEVTGGDLPAGVTLNRSTGVLSGTPTVAGIYTVEITLTDSVGVSDVKEFDLPVLGEGDAPSARDDYATTYLNTPVEIPVLENDRAATGALDPASIRIVNGPSHGQLAQNGVITYTPATGFSGQDQFLYTVMDTQGLESAEATVHITVRNEPAFTGCMFERRNRLLSVHHPAIYASAIRSITHSEFPRIELHAFRNARAVEGGIPIEITSVPAAFPGNSGLPERSIASGVTDGNGNAFFNINPPRPDPSNPVLFTARVQIDGNEYECSASISTAIGVQLLPFLDVLDRVAESFVARNDPAAPEPRMEFAGGPDRATGGSRRSAETLPLVIEDWRGTPGGVRAAFRARAGGVDLRLAPDQLEIADATAARLRIQFLGADPAADASIVEPLPGSTNYLLGSDPALWRAGVRQAARVAYRSVYPGIDLVYYGRHRRLEYDFYLTPGAAPDAIRLGFDADVEPRIDAAGDLLLTTAGSAVRLRKPAIFQENDHGFRIEIAGGYRIRPDGSVGFELGPYDPGKALVIDPVLDAATFVGGAAEDSISSVALDAEGNIYVTGMTASPGIGTPNALAPAKLPGGRGGTDGFIAKLDPTATQLLYLTYVGGSGEDAGFGIAVDREGNVLATGTTSSPDFPLANALQPEYGNLGDLIGFDAFALKLDPQGANLIYSTYLGGSGLEAEGKVAVDAAGNAYLTGSTSSTDLAVVNPVQAVRSGAFPFGTDAYVAKLTPAGQAVFVTYLGGEGQDWGRAIAPDEEGNVWVAGSTSSIDFPAVSAYQNASRGGSEGFLARISSDGQTLLNATYLGGFTDDVIDGLALDGDGNVYVAGSTGSGDFPLAAGAQMASSNPDGIGQDAFAAKFSANGASLMYSTLIGGSGNDLGHAIAVGADGSVYVAGDTTSPDLTLEGAPQTFRGGAADAFIAKIAPDGSSFEYTTYLGGSLNDGASALAVDAAGAAVVGGVTYSPDFPVTIGGARTEPPGAGESLAESFLVRLAPGEPEPSVVSLSSASFQRIYGLAPDSFATAFGQDLAEATLVDPELPTQLGGVTVTITDSSGEQHAARIYVVSPTQINYLLPPEVATGLATIAVTVNGEVKATETARIAPVAPGIFSAAASGSGVAAAVFLRVDADGTQTSDLVFDANTLAATPIDLGGEGAEVYIFLFGTGLRNSSGDVTVLVGGQQVAYAGPVAQGQFDGLDQLNIGPLPASLAGRGEVPVEVTIDGKTANVVTVKIR